MDGVRNVNTFEPVRAVEIVGPGYGSGYRIGGRLVLTAKHLFPDGAGSSCKVRDKGGFDTVDARVVWHAPQADVALVELPDSVALADSVSFGRFPAERRPDVIEFHLFG